MTQEYKNRTSLSKRHPIYTAEQAFTHLIQKRSETEQKLYIETDKVLFNVWDVLSLSMSEKYNDEYLPYLPHVFELLIHTTDGQDISDYLLYIEQQLGTAPHDTLAPRRAARAVDILLKIKEQIVK